MTPRRPPLPTLPDLRRQSERAYALASTLRAVLMDLETDLDALTAPGALPPTERRRLRTLLTATDTDPPYFAVDTVAEWTATLALAIERLTTPRPSTRRKAPARRAPTPRTRQTTR